jgi:hypothetical protein
VAREPVEIGYSDPYSDGSERPYVLIHVNALDGPGGDVWGLLDTGADVTCLPLGYAALIGYTPEQLDTSIGGSAGGSMTIWSARVPIRAWLVGLEPQPFELWPTFTEGVDTPLWGRRDVLLKFPTLFDEAAKILTLYVDAT